MLNTQSFVFMNLKKVALIIQREFITRVRKKSFILTTLLAPLSIFVVMGIQMFFMSFDKEKRVVAVYDESGLLYKKSVDGSRYLALPDGENVFFKQPTENYSNLRSRYHELGYDGVLHIQRVDTNRLQTLRPAYFSDNLLGAGARRYIENSIAEVLKNRRLHQEGIEPKLLEELRTIDVSIAEKKEGGESSSSFAASAIGLMMGMIMYIALIVYGSMVMKGVLEEKTNRIVEVMLSSVKPFELMLGKIVGIGAVGLLQFGIWAILMIVFSLLAGLLFPVPDAGALQSMPGSAAAAPDPEEAQLIARSLIDSVNSLPLTWLTLAFLFYFFTGYMMYASLFAAVGAAVGDTDDSQSLVFPVIMPVIISFFILTAIQEDPNNSLAMWSSMFPLFSPVIMPARIAFGVPLWQVLASMVFLLGGFWLATFIAAKIYRGSILMYGKKLNMKEMWHLLRHS